MTKDELRKAKRKWWTQRQTAKQRGIEFDFPFEEWLQFWLDSGHWHERGIKTPDQYVMSRKEDKGPYRIDNVEIKTNRENVLEGNKDRVSTHYMVKCPYCGFEYMNRTIMQHIGTRRCKMKKAPRRVLVQNKTEV